MELKTKILKVKQEPITILFFPLRVSVNMIDRFNRKNERAVNGDILPGLLPSSLI